MVCVRLPTPFFLMALPLVSAQTLLRSRIVTDITRECPTEPTTYSCSLMNLVTGETKPVPDSYQVNEGDEFSISCVTNALGPVIYRYGDEKKTENKSPYYMGGNLHEVITPVPFLNNCDAAPLVVDIEFKAGLQSCASTTLYLSPKCEPCGCPENAIPKDHIACPTMMDECVCKHGYKLYGDACVPIEGDDSSDDSDDSEDSEDSDDSSDYHKDDSSDDEDKDDSSDVYDKGDSSDDGDDKDSHYGEDKDDSDDKDGSDDKDTYVKYSYGDDSSSDDGDKDNSDDKDSYEKYSYGDDSSSDDGDKYSGYKDDSDDRDDSSSDSSSDYYHH